MNIENHMYILIMEWILSSRKLAVFCRVLWLACQSDPQSLLGSAHVIDSASLVKIIVDSHGVL